MSVFSQPCLPFEVDFCGLPVEDALIICRPPRNNTSFGSLMSATLFWSRSGWPILGVCRSTGDSSAARTRLQAKDVLLTCQLFCNGHNWAGNQKSQLSQLQGGLLNSVPTLQWWSLLNVMHTISGKTYLPIYVFFLHFLCHIYMYIYIFSLSLHIFYVCFFFYLLHSYLFRNFPMK